MHSTAGLLLLTTALLGQISSKDCQCGRQDSDGVKIQVKVTGGREAGEYEFPWVAHIRIKTRTGVYRCGGSLINDRFVVTAAHCVSERGISITVVLGEHDITVREGLEFTSRVKHFGYTTHNSYSEQRTLGVIEYDIAILELEKPVDFSEYKHIRPICLPSERFVDYTGRHELGTVPGWGTTLISYTSSSADGIVKGNPNRQSAADVLNKLTDVKILGHQECDAIFEDYERQTNGKAKLRHSNICGNSPTGDSCVGDSGSGLVSWNNQIQAYELIGVVSFGVGCNSSFHGTKLPGVYTRVSTTVNWIRGKSNRGTYCSSSPSSSTKPATSTPQSSPLLSGWSQWSAFSPCVGSGTIGTKERLRRCRDNTGETCGRLMQTQQRPCYT